MPTQWPTPDPEKIPVESPEPGEFGDLPTSGRGDDEPEED